MMGGLRTFLRHLFNPASMHADMVAVLVGRGLSVGDATYVEHAIWLSCRYGQPLAPAAKRLLEEQTCTGVAAMWCPLHGDCTCPQPLGEGLDPLDHHACPLHGPDSTHAAGLLR